MSKEETPGGVTGETEDAPASKAARRLLAADWLEITQMARAGVPVATIADTFRVTKATIYAGLKKRRVVIGAYTPSSTQIEESQERQELIKRIRETKENDYRYTEFLQRKAVKLLMDAERGDRPPASVLDDQKALKVAMDVIRAGTQNKWMILGLDRENADEDKELPELPIREMTEAEIIATRDQQLLDDADLEDLEASLAEDVGDPPDDEDPDE